MPFLHQLSGAYLLASESYQGIFLLTSNLRSLCLAAKLWDVFSNRALFSNSGGQPEELTKTYIVLGGLYFGASLTNNPSGGIPQLALGTLLSSSII